MCTPRGRARRLRRVALFGLAGLVGLAVAAPAAGAPGWTLSPHAALVGGVMHEKIEHTEGAAVDDERQDRTVTVAVSRFGFRGSFGERWSLVSEFEAAAGPASHGASVWEGQAALGVRAQELRVELPWGLRVAVGHIEDPSSYDFFSAHVADLLLTDAFTRSSLLASGANRGNGLILSWRPLAGLTAACALNAANPTSNTGILMVGGTYHPWERFYDVAIKDLGQDARHFPRDGMHMLVLSPSLSWVAEHVEAKATWQVYTVNHNTESPDVDTIDGHNLRASLRARLWGDRLVPFFNGSRVRNSVVDPRDGGQTIEGEEYTGLTFSGGLDVQLVGDSGLGVQYAQMRGQQGDEGTLRVTHTVNVGGTWFLDERTSVGARLGLLRKVAEPHQGETTRSGLSSLFATVRTLL